MQRRIAAFCGLLALLGAACRSPGGEPAAPSTSEAAATTTAPGGDLLAWEPCGEAECASLSVPRDYSAPGAGTFTLAVARLPAERPDLRVGTLIYVPGGPGLAATDGLSEGAFDFSVDLRARFDVVTLDPRGASAGALVDCVDDPDFFRGVDPTPESPAEVAELARRADQFIAACLDRSGDVLPYLSTTATARDLDLLRAALGEVEINYLGVSYGAALGAVYATLFPARVRGMVLDGGYDLATDPAVLAAQGAAARERALAGIFADCSADRLCYFNNEGASPAAYEALMASLDSRPMWVAPSLPPVDEGEAWRAVLFALPDRAMWTRLTMALHEAQIGDPMELLLLSEESVFFATGDGDAAVATGCLDWPHRGGQSTPTGSSRAAVSARLGTTAAAYLCERWPVAAQRAPEPGGGQRNPILVTAVTGDVLVAPESSRDLAAALPNGTFLLVEGSAHGAYQPTADDRACAVAVIDWYLISLIVPPAGSICRPSEPLPEPPTAAG